MALKKWELGVSDISQPWAQCSLRIETFLENFTGVDTLLLLYALLLHRPRAG
jgi:hypothetical protein